MLRWIVFSLISISLALPSVGYAWVKGIYVTQPTVQNTRVFTKLIKNAKAAGINTFIVDYQYSNTRYRRNIKLLRANNIRHVTRIVVFPDGGRHAQIQSEAYWKKKHKLIKAALATGAQEIQLDYIRYKPSQPASSQNARNVHKVIKWYKDKVSKHNVRLQIATFGIANKKPSRSIGQNVPLFANTIDVLCPMVYPSHYEPASYHSKRPYKTVLNSLNNLNKQMHGAKPYKLYPYIEVSNYRYPMSFQNKMNYIHAQINAVEDSNADGWYFWSPTNKYAALFRVLQNRKVR